MINLSVRCMVSIKCVLYHTMSYYYCIVLSYYCTHIMIDSCEDMLYIMLMMKRSALLFLFGPSFPCFVLLGRGRGRGRLMIMQERCPDVIVVGVDPVGSILALPDSLNDEGRLCSYKVRDAAGVICNTWHDNYIVTWTRSTPPPPPPSLSLGQFVLRACSLCVCACVCMFLF